MMAIVLKHACFVPITARGCRIPRHRGPDEVSLPSSSSNKEASCPIPAYKRASPTCIQQQSPELTTSILKAVVLPEDPTTEEKTSSDEVSYLQLVEATSSSTQQESTVALPNEEPGGALFGVPWGYGQCSTALPYHRPQSGDEEVIVDPTFLRKSPKTKRVEPPFRRKRSWQPEINRVGRRKHTRRPIAPGGHVSPEMEQVSSPGSASSTLLEEHHGDEDDEYDEDDATEETEIQSCDHEEVPIETVVPPNRPSTSTYDAIVASEGKIVDAENRRHSDMMTVLERMIGLQEETVSQLAHLHRVFIEVPKQLQKINTSFEALVVQQTQANYWRMTNVPQFNTSQPGSVHAGQFSPHSSDIHSPGPNVTGQVAEIAVQVPDDILPLPSVQNQQLTPTKEPTKTKYKQLLLTSFWSKTTKDTHETDQPSLVQCLPTCSHVSLGTSPVREQSLPKSPVGESLPKSPVGESLPKSPVGESLPKSPVGESLPKSPVGESLPKSPVGESLATSPVGESLATSPVGEQSLATSPTREVPEATQSGSVVPKVGGKRKRKIQETTSRPVTRSQKEQKK
ncbi:uncharacterized protein LOC142492292 [Ascaphus truei]|uniref:uncharacterized protein LOC142492292 n=1 Tax=Ascaphus truei TaxID=8439 RepID=UPI003F590C4F